MKKHYVGYCALASMLLLASCQEDFKDEVQPTISITSPAAGQKIWLDAPLTVDAADEQGVSKVAFYVDGELIGEDTEAPYELMFNTKDYEDGDYTLRTVAYDGAGNQTEAEREIEVFNKLLTVKVEGNYLNIPEEAYDRNDRAWIVVSDVKGNVLQTEELQNGTTFTFDRPEGFKESSATVTVINVNEYSSDDRWAFATTYTNIAPDHWIMQGYTSDKTEPTVVGTATGSFVTPDHNFRTSSPNGSFYQTSGSHDYEDGMRTEFMLNMYQDPAQLYIAAVPYQQAPLYVSLKGIQPGDQYELTSDDMLPMKARRSISLPSANYGSMFVRGYYDGDDGYHTASRSELEETTNNLQVYTPEGVFDSFSYSIDANFGDFFFYRRDEGGMPDSYDIPSSSPGTIHNAQINDFRATVDRQRDYAEASWSDYDSEESFRYARWAVVGSSDKEAQWVAPTLPAVVSKAYPSLAERINNLPFFHLQVIDRDDVDSYEAYAAKLYKQQKEDHKTYESVGTSLSQDESSRKGIVEIPAHIQQN